LPSTKRINLLYYKDTYGNSATVYGQISRIKAGRIYFEKLFFEHPNKRGRFLFFEGMIWLFDGAPFSNIGASGGTYIRFNTEIGTYTSKTGDIGLSIFNPSEISIIDKKEFDGLLQESICLTCPNMFSCDGYCIFE